MRPSESYPTLRERVRDVLLAANFKAREDTLPTLSSRGTFFLKPGAGLAVEVHWWDSSDGDRRALLLRYARALADAGFVVDDGGDKLYVTAPGKDSSDEG